MLRCKLPTLMLMKVERIREVLHDRLKQKCYTQPDDSANPHIKDRNLKMIRTKSRQLLPMSSVLFPFYFEPK